MRMPSARRALSLVLRAAVSVALIAVMLSRLDLGDMGAFLWRANLALVFLTLASVVADRCLMAARWIYLLEALGLRQPRALVVRVFFLSTFFGSFLPAGVGGDAVRALTFSKLSTRSEETVASVVMDRALGMLSMFLTALIALALFYRISPHPALLGVVVAAAVTLLIGVGMLLTRSEARPLSAAPGSEWRGWLQRTIAAFGRYRRHLGSLLLVLVLSMSVQVLRIFQAYWLSESMALGTALVYFFCFVPLILVVTMLPVSVSGWGTTNLAYVALFGQVGMDPAGAFVLSALILALGIVGNLPGGVLYALEGFSVGRAESVTTSRLP